MTIGSEVESGKAVGCGRAYGEGVGERWVARLQSWLQFGAPFYLIIFIFSIVINFFILKILFVLLLFLSSFLLFGFFGGWWHGFGGG